MLTTLIRTAIIYILLTLVLRLMGKRQIGELEITELVTTLLLSEIATIPIDNPDTPLLFALVPILLIVSSEIILSYLKNKSSPMKRFFDGAPSFLIAKGKLDQEELARNRLSLEELLGELRLQGAADIADVNYAILEMNGTLSVIQKQKGQGAAAATTKEEPGIAHSIIIDGRIQEGSLTFCGKDRIWLERQLQKKGVKAKEVFLMTLNDGGKVGVIQKAKKKKQKASRRQQKA